MASGYDNILQTIARQQATIDRLTRDLDAAQTRLAEMDVRLSASQDLTLRLSQAEARADTAQRAADDALRQVTTWTDRARGTEIGVQAQAVALTRLDALATDTAARVAAAPPVDAGLADMGARLSRMEDAAAAAGARLEERLGQLSAAFLRDATAARNIANTAQTVAEQTRTALDSVAANLAADIAAVEARRAESAALPDAAVENIMRAVADTGQQMWLDPVLATARSMGGLQVPSSAVISLDTAKLTNLVTTWNANTGFSAASITTGTLGASVVVSGANVSTGDVPQAQMQTNVVGAINAVGTGVAAAVISSGNLATARMQTNIMAAVTASGNDLALGAGQKFGVYGTTPPAQQSVTVLTNNVTSGGSANIIADFTDLSNYNADAATIRNNIYQIGQQLNLIRTAIKNYGLLA